MPKRLVNAIIRAYRRDPERPFNLVRDPSGKVSISGILSPFAALRVVMLSEGNSIWKALRRVPMYATDTLYKYARQFNQYRRNVSDRIAEI